MLSEYRKKRDFSITPEPMPVREKIGKTNIFVVQQHDARRMHYDFRIEIDGVLKSWAVPKGPSMNPKDKRLAVLTEDHPIEYSDFEGVIPEGEYGAGPVIIWDKGIFANAKEYSLSEAFEKGHIEIFLKGEKLKGLFSIIKAKLGHEEKNWLLVKMKDEFASEQDILEKNKSIISGKDIEEMKASK